ncbi:AAA family ATPase [Gaoshiqia sp. Z1-71]|uniref:AAA family ATPase n=1 Tax=Gaoshiqia hydrogeniformans TaxID=3290090 RepID=UPI003BF81C6C
MSLLEREEYLTTLGELYSGSTGRNGHTVFVTGEAGIGKTSLINEFVQRIEKEALVLTGTCDSLITPRPLGPLFDITWQLSKNFQELVRSEKETALLFSSFMAELKALNEPLVLIFEDVHWADGGTLDLIKFLSRRIHHIRCLFILTYREEAVFPDHPIRSVFSEIPSGLFTKIKIEQLSFEAVSKLSKATSFDPVEVYNLTGGNPFYVNEILAWYSPGIPDNIKDSVLTVFHKQVNDVKALWELISVLPGKIDLNLLSLIEPNYLSVLDNCIHSGVLRTEGKFLLFKHELYRRTIEEALPGYRRIQLNKKILDILLAHKPEESDMAILIHVAQNAQNTEVISRYAPLAAKKASALGAHLEAAKLFMMAIEHSSLTGLELAQLYEQHAYECYLTNQIQKAIDSQQLALTIWQKLGDKIRIGVSYRILSRLNWFQGKKDNAERFAIQAIEELENGFPLEERGRAYSNYAQLKMLSGETELAVEYGEKALDLAKKIDNEEILCHALNNIGSALLQKDKTNSRYLYTSLDIALRNGYHEHVARAYTNIASYSIEHKKYQEGLDALNSGIDYCNGNDLDSWTYYMLTWKARLLFELCKWDEAAKIAGSIVEFPTHPNVVRIGALIVLGRLSVRVADYQSAIIYLEESKELALSTKELQRIAPVTVALLEYGWITKNKFVFKDILKVALNNLKKVFIESYYSELVFWMHRNGLKYDKSKKILDPYHSYIVGRFDKAAERWKSMGCNYEYALSLFEGTREMQKESLIILDKLGAVGTLNILKDELRAKGIKSIPRGPRSSTKKNTAHLTRRQVDVLNLLKEGLQNTEIADKLFISPKTVDHHVSAILFKLEVNSRNKAVIEAEKLGII